MKGFIVYSTYRIVNDKAYVFLFGRLENGENFVTINHFRPYFYIKDKQLEKAKKIADFEHERTNLKTFKGDKVARIILDIPKDVKKLRKILQDEGIPCFEADIRFEYRYMIDKGLQGAIDIEGEYDSEGAIDRVYKDSDIKPADYTPKNLKVMSIDIETSENADEIYCMAVVCGDFKKVIIRTDKRLKNTISVKDEEELLEKFEFLVQELDPDVITGWHVIDFDFKVILDKSKEYGIQLNLGRDNSNCKIRFEQSFFLPSKADFPGRMVLDGIALLKTSFINLNDYKLDSVAQKYLGEGKLIQSQNRGQEITRLFNKSQQKLVDYNLKDAELVLGIIDKTETLKLSVQRSLLTGMPLDRVGASIASLDSLYIKEARKRGLLVPGGAYVVKEERIKGGYVKESEPGIYDNIVVMDFKSLYPSIIRTFNIDPASYVKSCKGKNLVKAANGACFRNEEGILPTLIQRLWESREKARKAKNELARYAIKILMNSFFGVLATPNCRFFNLDIANAITHTGQELIKLTSEKIEKKGYPVIYGDTDSIFMQTNAKTCEEAAKIGEELQNEINKYYDEHIKKKHKRKSYLELEYEKCYLKFLMPKIRGKEVGAKKRYAGLLMKKGKEEMDITGMEAIRSDWTELAKTYQLAILDRIFHNKEIADYTKKFIDDLRKGKHDALLIYRKSIRKNLDEYIKTTPPHVKAARKLERLDGNVIEYVMTEDGPEPVQAIKHPIDYEHYINKQIKPIAESVLCFFDKHFEDLVQGSTQTTLFGFK
jgi:DNA polymerase-2